MKQFLVLLIFIAGITHIKCQTFTITQSFNEPFPGEFEHVWKLDTSAYLAGIPSAGTGSNVVWNFANMGAVSHATVFYLPPSSVISATAYPGCSLVQRDDTVDTFIKNVTTPNPQTEIVGMDISLGSLSLNNSAIAMKYPFTYGDSIGDNVSGTFASQFANGTCSGKITTLAKATGTLLLPAGKKLSNVLGVTTTLTLNLTAFSQVIGTVSRSIRSFYHASEKFPVITIAYTSISLIGSGTPVLTANVYGNAFILVGLNKHESLPNNSVKVFPNPFTSMLQLNAEPTVAPQKTEIVNNLGQLVYSGPFTSEINTSAFAPGIYVLTIYTSKGLIHTKIVKH